MTSTPPTIIGLKDKTYGKRMELPNNRIRRAYRKALKDIVTEEFGGPKELLKKAREKEDPFLRVLAIDTFE